MSKLDTSTRPYSYEDLVKAVNDYSHAKGNHEAAVRMVASKKSEMDSFQRDADTAFDEVDRRRTEIRKILRNLEE